MFNKLAKVCQLIVALVTRDVTDPEIAALVAALGVVIAAPSFATIAKLAMLVVKRVIADTTDPQILALVQSLEDLVAHPSATLDPVK